VASARTNRPFADEVQRVLETRALSVSALARQAGVSQPYLSRLLRRSDYKKTPSVKVASAVAEALGFPADYFPEYREGRLVEEIKKSARLRDELYDDVVIARRRRK